VIVTSPFDEHGGIKSCSNGMFVPAKAMDKKQLTEADIRSKFITPALVQGGKWDLMSQVREETYFTKGRVIVRGRTVKRGEAKKADYILYYKPNIPIAVIEAKDNNHSAGAGMAQARLNSTTS
jgi:type I restriction enzyme R subunit